MSALTDHLERLVTWLRELGPIPDWHGVKLIEAKDVTWAAVSKIPRVALRSPAEYADHFDELLNRGYSWLNLSALGVLDGELIVCVELPRDTTGVFGRTSVNLSGPPLDAGKPVWDASVRHRIT